MDLGSSKKIKIDEKESPEQEAHGLSPFSSAFDEADEVRAFDEESLAEEFPSLVPKSAVIAEVHNHDVIFDRPKHHKGHLGNEYFERKCAEVVPAFRLSSRDIKAVLMEAVRRDILSLNPPGRFLQYIPNNHNHNNHFLLLDKLQSRRRIAHRLHNPPMPSSLPDHASPSPPNTSKRVLRKTSRGRSFLITKPSVDHDKSLPMKVATLATDFAAKELAKGKSVLLDRLLAEPQQQQQQQQQQTSSATVVSESTTESTISQISQSLKGTHNHSNNNSNKRTRETPALDDKQQPHHQQQPYQHDNDRSDKRLKTVFESETVHSADISDLFNSGAQRRTHTPPPTEISAASLAASVSTFSSISLSDAPSSTSPSRPPSHFPEISLLQADYPNLTGLTISFAAFDSLEHRHFVEALRNNSVLTTLHLTNLQLESHVASLIHALAHNSTILHINITDSDLGDIISKKLHQSQLLLTHKSIKHFTFSRNGLTINGMKDLAMALFGGDAGRQTNVLAGLNLSQNHSRPPHGDFSIKILTDSFLRSKPTNDKEEPLSYLALHHNNIGPRGIINYLSHVLSSPRVAPRLRILDLSSNPILNRGAEALAGALPSHNSIQTLLLKYCSIGDKGANAFLNVVLNRSCRSLHTLALDGNKISLDILDRLRTSLSEHHPQTPTNNSTNNNNNKAELLRNIDVSSPFRPSRNISASTVSTITDCNSGSQNSDFSETNCDTKSSFPVENDERLPKKRTAEQQQQQQLPLHDKKKRKQLGRMASEETIKTGHLKQDIVASNLGKTSNADEEEHAFWLRQFNDEESSTNNDAEEEQLSKDLCDTTSNYFIHANTLERTMKKDSVSTITAKDDNEHAFFESETCFQLGLEAKDRGDYDDATDHFMTSLLARSDLRGPDHIKVAQVHRLLHELELSKGDTHAAKIHLSEAERIERLTRNNKEGDDDDDDGKEQQQQEVMKKPAVKEGDNEKSDPVEQRRESSTTTTLSGVSNEIDDTLQKIINENEVPTYEGAIDQSGSMDSHTFWLQNFHCEKNVRPEEMEVIFFEYETCYQLGHAAKEKRDYDDANDQFMTALLARTQMHGPNHPKVAEVHRALHEVAVVTDDTNAANVHLSEANRIDTLQKKEEEAAKVTARKEQGVSVETSATDPSLVAMTLSSEPATAFGQQRKEMEYIDSSLSDDIRQKGRQGAISAKRKKQEDAQLTFIRSEDIRDHDVLLGSSSQRESTHNTGNDFYNSKCGEYRRPKRSSNTSANNSESFAAKAVRAVLTRDPPGRFLLWTKKVDSHNLWTLMSEKEAVAATLKQWEEEEEDATSDLSSPNCTSSGDKTMSPNDSDSCDLEEHAFWLRQFNGLNTDDNDDNKGETEHLFYEYETCFRFGIQAKEKGDHEDAVDYLMTALLARTDLRGSDHRKVAEVHRALYEVATASGDETAAKVHLSEAQRIENTLPPPPPQQGESENQPLEKTQQLPTVELSCPVPLVNTKTTNHDNELYSASEEENDMDEHSFWLRQFTIAETEGKRSCLNDNSMESDSQTITKDEMENMFYECETCFQLGIEAKDRGDCDDACNHFMTALLARTDTRGPNHPKVAEVHHALYELAVATGDSNAANVHLSEVKRIEKRVNTTVDVTEEQKKSPLILVNKEQGVEKVIKENLPPQPFPLTYVRQCTANFSEATREMIDNDDSLHFHQGRCPKSGLKFLVKSRTHLDGSKDEKLIRSATRKLCREVEVGSQYRSDRIAKVFGFSGKFDEPDTVLSESTDVGTLQNLLRDENQGIQSFDWKSRIGIAFDISLGLYYLHTSRSNQACFHRDISPSNILLRRNESDKRLEGLISNLGTCQFLPRKAPNDHHPDFSGLDRKDIEGLGCVLLDLFLGKRGHLKNDEIMNIDGREHILYIKKHADKRAGKWDECAADMYIRLAKDCVLNSFRTNSIHAICQGFHKLVMAFCKIPSENIRFDRLCAQCGKTSCVGTFCKRSYWPHFLCNGCFGKLRQEADYGPFGCPIDSCDAGNFDLQDTLYALSPDILPDELRSRRRPAAKAPLPLSSYIQVLYSSPLALLHRTGKLQPVHMLDVERETNLMRNTIPSSFQIATRETFQRAIAPIRPQESRCLHFSGHGEGKYMFLQDQCGGACPLSLNEILDIFNNNADDTRETDGGSSTSSLQLVFLSFSNSESIGRAFVRGGVPHVICSSGDVLDSAHQIFARHFYVSLVRGDAVKTSFNKALRSVYNNTSLQGSTEHILRSFRLLPSTEPHNVVIFRPNAGSGPDQNVPSSAGIPNPPNNFLGRHVDMYRILNYLVSRGRLVYVKGASEVGFVLAAISRYVIDIRSISEQMHEVFYIDCAALTGVDSFVTALYRRLLGAKVLEPLAYKISSDDDLTNHVTTALHQRRALVVIDGGIGDDGEDRCGIYPALEKILTLTRFVRILMGGRVSSAPVVVGGEFKWEHCLYRPAVEESFDQKAPVMAG